MYRNSARFGVVLVIGVFAVGSAASQQSLGDIARQNRTNGTARPTPKRVITNEDLGLPAEGRPAANGDSADAASSDAANAKTKTKADAKSGGASADTAAGTAKADATSEAKDSASAAPAERSPAAKLAEWKQRVSDERQKVDLLEREYNVAVRENQIKNSEYYADAGSRLRNQQQWSEQQAKLRTEMDKKKKELDAEKQKLADMIEEARKDGVPSSQLQ